MIRSPLFNDFVNLRNSIDQLANEAFGDDPLRSLTSRGASNGGAVAQAMPLAVYATDDQIVILAAVPGMQPEDLELTIHQNTVTLSGSVRNVVDSDEARNATWYLHELGSGSYRRSVTVPFPVDADQADATFEHGMLRVVLPKAEAAKPRKINISGGRQREAIDASQ
jgi:HSP20 family protein